MVRGDTVYCPCRLRALQPGLYALVLQLLPGRRRPAHTLHIAQPDVQLDNVQRGAAGLGLFDRRGGGLALSGAADYRAALRGVPVRADRRGDAGLRPRIPVSGGRKAALLSGVHAAAEVPQVHGVHDTDVRVELHIVSEQQPVDVSPAQPYALHLYAHKQHVGGVHGDTDAHNAHVAQGAAQVLLDKDVRHSKPDIRADRAAVLHYDARAQLPLRAAGHLAKHTGRGPQLLLRERAVHEPARGELHRAHSLLFGGLQSVRLPGADDGHLGKLADRRHARLHAGHGRVFGAVYLPDAHGAATGGGDSLHALLARVYAR